MFSRSFGLFMLGPNADGNPGPVAHPIVDVARSIGHHPVGFDAVFVLVQLLIALGIANRRTVKIGLAGSVVWAVLVWWLGEGLGMVLAGTASPLTGAPGAVLLYALVAVLLWPTERRADAAAAEHVGAVAATVIWIGVFGALGLIALVGSATRHPGRLFGGMEDGEPGWLVTLDRHVVSATAGHGAALAAGVGVVLLVVAVSVLLDAARRPAIALAVAFSVFVWVTGENFGQLFTGFGTDPNTGPLLILLALAYWPSRRAPAPNVPPTHEPAVAA